ncbi:leukocyte immunoglobulin-like receptor subfamily A member 5 isoform X1 [Bos indicus x Bos taurus]|uniref:leukocyte immunoglobulin-like receptor subfamily A member 5 isoform X1 n=1 Tax=Bos indicus x Bos taurus TaxID=30522 RepID=UPI000F7D25DB|nr:leukocyte immunoglobulin-like receptor subfamily A member 5 isoform X1 [Bos indicus x Bos taurus]
MAPTLPALLCLGLSVGLRTQVQAGTFPKPIIWAEPSSVVPLGSSVTILCQGPPNTKSFSLNKEGDSTPWNIHPSLEPWDKANFFISNVREQQAGRYHCSHFIGVNWSEPSEPLDLLVAGEEPAGRLRDRPSLSVRPSPSVAPGENVTLLCQSGNRTDTFLLSKEGAAHRPLRLRSQDQDGWYQAEFSLSPVTSAHGGTYRCYRSLSTNPYLLSQPSEPLALLVAESHPDGPRSLGPAAPWDPALPGSARPRRSPRSSPELSTGTSHRLERWSLGRELPAQELLEEPLNPGERRAAGREEARESPAAGGRWGLGLCSRRGVGGGVRRGPPSRGGSPTPVSAHPRLKAPPNARGRVLALHARKLCPLMEDVSFIVNASRLWCAQRPPSLLRNRMMWTSPGFQRLKLRLPVQELGSDPWFPKIPAKPVCPND